MGESDHVQKGLDYSRGLKKLLENRPLSPSDRKAAQKLLDDLSSALNEALER